jgi:broad specificity phosphatase PhoE
MQQLILARHGESEYSSRGLLNGDPSVAVGLTAAGEAQARALGSALRETPIDLCVTTEFGRTQRTAALVLAGRDVSVEVWPDLNDPQAGSFEGLPIHEYLVWAAGADSAETMPGGGQSRRAIVARCARAYRALLERPEPVILVVLHGLPIAYLLGALEGTDPAPRMGRVVEYAHPYRVEAGELRAAVELLERWCAAPTW